MIHITLPRLFYCHICIEIQKLPYVLSNALIIIWRHNPVPTPKSLSQSLWKPFENKGLHFLHLNINSILPKLDELKTIAGNTKAVIIGITECKIDNSISDSEVEILGYCNLRCDRNRNGGGVACYVRQDWCFNLRSTAIGDIKGMFLMLCYLRQNQSL